MTALPPAERACQKCGHAESDHRPGVCLPLVAGGCNCTGFAFTDYPALHPDDLTVMTPDQVAWVRAQRDPAPPDPTPPTTAAPNCYCGKAYIPQGADSWLSASTMTRHRRHAICYPSKPTTESEGLIVD